MVHALEEAWRVLTPDGLLIDLRPAMVHRSVAVVGRSAHTKLGFMREWFEDDIAANRAVAAVVRRGLFRRRGRERIACTRSMDTLDEFRSWLDAYAGLNKLPSHDWLVKKIAPALTAAGRGARIVVSGPLDLQVLAKRESR